MYETELPIRDDLRAAHEATVDRWSRPGTWWTAEERLAIVVEVRRARDADEIPPAWVRASEVEGAAAEDHLLAAAAGSASNDQDLVTRRGGLAHDHSALVVSGAHRLGSLYNPTELRCGRVE